MVAPLVGAWIEISAIHCYLSNEVVAPLVGAWIEILRGTLSDVRFLVAPLVGAWIEIFSSPTSRNANWSLPLWERGLKSI